MKKIHIINTFLAVVAVFICMASLTSAYAANLLDNPSFETQFDTSPTIANNWFFWEYWTEEQDEPTVERSLEIAQDGIASIKTFSSGSNEGWYGVLQQVNDLTAGEDYTFSGYILTPNADPLTGGNFASLKIEFYNDDNTILDQYESVHITSADAADTWHYIEMTETAPIDTDYAKFLVQYHNTGLPGEIGTIYYDNLDVPQPLGGGVPEPSTVVLVILGMCGIGYVKWRKRQ